MSTALVSLTSQLAKSFNLGDGQELMQTLKQTAFKGQVSDSQMTALLIVANQYKLNPWTKEIYAFPDQNNGIVPVVGVDGWARIINSHDQFDGIEFEQDDEKCTCKIFRKDRSHATSVTEYLSECKRSAKPWQSHPKRMLRHKAMIQCARLAFGFVGIYDQDEAERINEPEPTSENQIDISPLINAAKATTTDAEALKFWKENNGELIKYPSAHAQLKEVVSLHRANLQELEKKTIDTPAQDNSDFVAAMDQAGAE